MRLINKIREVGIVNTVKGTIKREKYKRLSKQYDFDSWHISPYELRGYAQGIVKYINNNLGNNLDYVIVDLGCGLGEVIRNIKYDKKIGMDYDAKAIECAKTLVTSKDYYTEYKVGSFDELGENKLIEYFITLGFMHGGHEETWVNPYHDVCKKNDIKKVVVDVIPEGYNGAHCLDFTKILPEEYRLIERLGPFLNGRFIEIYEKQ